MRYLKEYNRYRYYNGIGFAEWERSQMMDVEITLSEVERIKDFCGEECHLEYGGMDIFAISISFSGEDYPYMDIHKTEDEWFWVNLNTESGDEYYKCDQLDGLFKLIRDSFWWIKFSD